MNFPDGRGARCYPPAAGCRRIDDAPCGVDMLLHFTGTCLTVQARKSFDPATNAYEGVATGYVEEDADES